MARGGSLKMLGKIAAILAPLLAIWKGLEPILTPILKMLGVVMQMLFLPLIPILMPVMKALGEMAEKLAPVMTDIMEKVGDAFEEGGLGQAVAVWLQEMLDQVLPVVMPVLIEGFKAFIEGLLPYLPQIINKLVSGLVMFLEALIPFIPKLVWRVLKVLAKVAFQIGQYFFKLGNKIGDWLLNKVIKPVGNWISDKIKGLWDAIKSAWDWVIDKIKSIGRAIKSAISFIPGVGGGHTTSANDALITSKGDIVKFNKNDNIMAFQDFGKVQGGGTNININVKGFVGSEKQLADQISKAVNKANRGGER